MKTSSVATLPFPAALVQKGDDYRVKIHNALHSLDKTRCAVGAGLVPARHEGARKGRPYKTTVFLPPLQRFQFFVRCKVFWVYRLKLGVL